MAGPSNNNDRPAPGSSGAGADPSSGSGSGSGSGASSGYITNFWQALFASLIQLLSRIFRPKSGNTSSKQSPSHTPPPATAPAPAPAPAPAAPPSHPASSSADTHHQPAIVITDTDDAATAPVSDIDTTTTNAAPSPQGQHHSDSDLEKGDPLLDEAMAAAKKRGGQKRTTAKTANGSSYVPNNTVALPQQQQQLRDKENVIPGNLPVQPAASAPLNKPFPTPAPLSTKDDNQANSKHQQLPVTRALDAVPSPGKPHDRQPAITELGNNTSNNASPAAAPTTTTTTPSTNAREAPKPTSPQTPLSTVVVPTTNQSEVQSSGSHSAAGAQNADPLNLPAMQRVPPIDDANMDQATATLEMLNVDHDNKPDSKPDLDKDTAAIAAAAVPIVVSIPGLKQPIIPKPLAPLVTPPSQVLPGLIEPTTEEGKIERAQHLKFMREALAMVSV
ncbi:uncharacterized protein PG986_010797 [Apiospora aurea]|uniref:Uncharacterized protein n=1 Tax=Apiospora aurea TaxID=335848 RepID=A0ABR1Q397_9PEZI